MSSLCERFYRAWHKYYGELNPISYTFKYKDENWIRFHSLPESKRYADNAGEMEIILDRQNRVLKKAIDLEQTYFVVWAMFNSSLIIDDDETWEETETSEQEKLEWQLAFEAEIEGLTAVKERLSKIAKLEPCETFIDDETRYQFFAGEVVGELHELNTILEDIAEERIDKLFFFSPMTGNIFAPYDGGMDIICPNKSELGELKEKFRQFLPKNGRL